MPSRRSSLARSRALPLAWSASRPRVAGSALTAERLPKFILGALEHAPARGAHPPAAAVDVEIQHGHRGLIRGSLSTLAAEGGALERGGHRPRARELEDIGFQIERIARLRDVLRPLLPAALRHRPPRRFPRRRPPWPAPITATLTSWHAHVPPTRRDVRPHGPVSAVVGEQPLCLPPDHVRGAQCRHQGGLVGPVRGNRSPERRPPCILVRSFRLEA